MTNAEKFIEVMNEYFDAGLTKENLDFEFRPCSPCGVFRKGACDTFACSGCAKWWDKEWKPKRSEQTNEKTLSIPCTKVEEKTVKDWFQKINEELDELKEAVFKEHFVLRVDTQKCKRWFFVTEQAECKHIAEEAADTITTITSMLEAMGIDEEMRQDAQKRVNERNKERGRF